MSKQTVSDYTWTYTEQPHRSRRKEILAKHPEVRDLFGFCPKQKYWVTASVLAQITIAYLIRDQSWWVILPLAYIVGGTINHSLFLAFHELAHNLFFDSPFANSLFGLFANLPMTLAVSVYVHRAEDALPSLPFKGPSFANGGPHFSLLFRASGLAIELGLQPA